MTSIPAFDGARRPSLPEDLSLQLRQIIDSLREAALLLTGSGEILYMNEPAMWALRIPADQCEGAMVSPLPAEGGRVEAAGIFRIRKDDGARTSKSCCRFGGRFLPLGDYFLVLVDNVDADGITVENAPCDGTLKQFLGEGERQRAPLHRLSGPCVAVPVRPGIPHGLVVRVASQEDLGMLVRYYRGAPAFVAAGRFVDLVRLASDIAAENYPVLVEGARGSGKRMLAHLLHFWSLRSTQPLAVLSADDPWWDMPPSDGASVDDAHPVLERIGRAARGTLILHHAHRLPDRWLNWFRQAIEEGITGIGAYPPGGLRCRVIVTCVAGEVPSGQSWRDFENTVAVQRLVLPDLKSCPEMISPLSIYFACQFAFRFRSPVRFLTPELLSWLEKEARPEDIRQLRSLIYQACARCRGPELTLRHLEPAGGRTPGRRPTDEEVIETVRKCGGNAAQAARILGVSASTVYRRLRQLRGVGQ